MAQAETGEVADDKVEPSMQEAAEPQMSKRALKKQQKKAALQEFRAAKKEKEKEAKAEVMRERKAESDAQFNALPEQEQAKRREFRLQRAKEKEAEKAAQRARLEAAVASGPHIIIDLDFDDKMTESEIVSLTQQISYCHGKNQRSERPLGIQLTSCNKRIAQSLNQRMQTFQQWQGVLASEKSYKELHSNDLDNLVMNSAFNIPLVYLTADAENVIETLEPDKKYIIGGLVDRNRHKNICKKRAQSDGLKTARLPISEHVQLQGSCVLTVDQVFAILLHFHAHGDWAQSITQQLPARKFQPLADGGKGSEEKEDPCKNIETAQDEGKLGAGEEVTKDEVLPQKRKAADLEQ